MSSSDPVLPDNLAATIERLTHLWQTGIVTEQEFLEEKQRILKELESHIGESVLPEPHKGISELIDLQSDVGALKNSEASIDVSSTKTHNKMAQNLFLAVGILGIAGLAWVFTSQPSSDLKSSASPDYYSSPSTTQQYYESSDEEQPKARSRKKKKKGSH